MNFRQAVMADAKLDIWVDTHYTAYPSSGDGLGFDEPITVIAATSNRSHMIDLLKMPMTIEWGGNAMTITDPVEIAAIFEARQAVFAIRRKLAQRAEALRGDTLSPKLGAPEQGT